MQSTNYQSIENTAVAKAAKVVDSKWKYLTLVGLLLVAGMLGYVLMANSPTSIMDCDLKMFAESGTTSKDLQQVCRHLNGKSMTSAVEVPIVMGDDTTKTSTKTKTPKTTSSGQAKTTKSSSTKTTKSSSKAKTTKSGSSVTTTKKSKKIVTEAPATEAPEEPEGTKSGKSQKVKTTAGCEGNGCTGNDEGEDSYVKPGYGDDCPVDDACTCEEHNPGTPSTVPGDKDHLHGRELIVALRKFANQATVLDGVCDNSGVCVCCKGNDCEKATEAPGCKGGKDCEQGTEAPGPEEVIHTKAPGPEQVTKAPGPEEVVHTKAPGPENVIQTKAPGPEEVTQNTKAPGPEVVEHTAAPGPGGCEGSNCGKQETKAPGPEQVVHTKAPGPEVVEHTAAPGPGGCEGSDCGKQETGCQGSDCGGNSEKPPCSGPGCNGKVPGEGGYTEPNDNNPCPVNDACTCEKHEPGTPSTIPGDKDHLHGRKLIVALKKFAQSATVLDGVCDTAQKCQCEKKEEEQPSAGPICSKNGCNGGYVACECPSHSPNQPSTVPGDKAHLHGSALREALLEAAQGVQDGEWSYRDPKNGECNCENKLVEGGGEVKETQTKGGGPKRH